MQIQAIALLAVLSIFGVVAAPSEETPRQQELSVPSFLSTPITRTSIDWESFVPMGLAKYWDQEASTLAYGPEFEGQGLGYWLVVDHADLSMLLVPLQSLNSEKKYWTSYKGLEFAQGSVHDGQRHGATWIFNGEQYLITGNYESGSPTGVWRRFSTDGKVEDVVWSGEEFVRARNVPHESRSLESAGRMVMIRGSDQSYSYGLEKSGIRIGHWFEYSGATAQIAIGPYEDGQKSGPWTILSSSRNSNGTEASTFQVLEYKQGVPHGAGWSISAGSIVERFELRSGDRDGMAEVACEDGSYAQGPMSGGERDGAWLLRSTEKKWSLQQYKNGSRVGEPEPIAH